MASTCPGCGKKFNLFDRISGVPMCLTCEKGGVLVPRDAVETEENKTDLIAGWFVVIATVGFILFVLIVPARDGASSGGKLRLLGFALVGLGSGVGMVARARARLHRSRSKTSNKSVETTREVGR